MKVSALRVMNHQRTIVFLININNGRIMLNCRLEVHARTARLRHFKFEFLSQILSVGDWWVTGDVEQL